MNIEIFKDDINGLLRDVIDSFHTLQMAAMYQNATISKLPNLNLYYPQTIQELEILRFNLVGEIPSRLNTDEEIATWLLETNELDREIVALFLCSSHQNNISAILDVISKRICIMDISGDFISGLKLYLPIVGGIVLTSHNDSNSFEIQPNENNLETLLTSYAKSHLEFSRKPLIAINNNNSILFVMEIAKTIVILFKYLTNPDKPISATSLQFIKDINLLSNYYNYEITIKTLNELFSIITNSTNLLPFPILDRIPSYLFTTILKSGWIKLGFSNDSEVMLTVYARLCLNAIYIFSDETSSIPQGCIPLESIRAHVTDNIETYSIIELIPILDPIIPYISMTTVTSNKQEIAINENINENKIWPAPEEVTFHSKFVLEILNDNMEYIDITKTGFHSPINMKLSSKLQINSNNNNNNLNEEERIKYQKHIEIVGQWLDLLETCSWGCRYNDDII